MTITASRRTFEVTGKDKILDNGSCYQLITQTYTQNWSKLTPIISKATFNKLLKDGIVYKTDEEYAPCVAKGCIIYRFKEQA